MTRPAETIQAAIAAIIGAIVIIIGAVDDGFQFSDLTDPEVIGAITVLVGFVSAAVTYVVAKRQRDPAADLGSAGDGTVVKTS